MITHWDRFFVVAFVFFGASAICFLGAAAATWHMLLPRGAFIGASAAAFIGIMFAGFWVGILSIAQHFRAFLPLLSIATLTIIFPFIMMLERLLPIRDCFDPYALCELTYEKATPEQRKEIRAIVIGFPLGYSRGHGRN